MAPDSESGERFDARCVVIGAGAAGLVTAKSLLDREIDVDVLEAGDTVGGMWQIDSPGSAAYETLQTNSSRTQTEFSDFPMPVPWPDFPTYRQMASYLEMYADAFELRDHIRLGTTVTSVEPVPGPGMPGDNGWAVRVAEGPTRFYENVIVATGHHRRPHLPDLPGTFTGKSLHSRDYRDPDIFLAKRVLIIGAGNSGTDLAVDSARRAEETLLATRHDLEVLPRYLLGRPYDQLRPGVAGLLPAGLERSLFDRFIRVGAAAGQVSAAADEVPTTRSPAPPVAPDLPDLVESGAVQVKPGVTRLSGGRATFADGSRAGVDLVVFATGYDVHLPYLSPEIFAPTGNVMPLYRNVVAPQRPGLWFVGFIDTIGAAMPLFQEQSEWVADVLSGACVLPGRSAMRTWIAKREQDGTVVDSHPLLVDYWRYRKSLRQERSRTRSKPKLRDRLPAR